MARWVNINQPGQKRRIKTGLWSIQKLSLRRRRPQSHRITMTDSRPFTFHQFSALGTWTINSLPLLFFFPLSSLLSISISSIRFFSFSPLFIFRHLSCPPAYSFLFFFLFSAFLDLMGIKGSMRRCSRPRPRRPERRKLKKQMTMTFDKWDL